MNYLAMLDSDSEANRESRRAWADRITAQMATRITRMAPEEVWEWLDLGTWVDFADRHFQRTANRYEDGEATKEEVLSAAEALHAAWQEAVRRFAAATQPEGM